MFTNINLKSNTLLLLNTIITYIIDSLFYYYTNG
jgi:hypothetical protein